MTGEARPGSWTWLLAAIMVLQLGWLVVVPAFTGIDEFDHAYRAASVAQGHWWDETQRPPGDGRGQLIPVPEHLVRAAHGACADLPYVGPDNCTPASEPDADGNVLVASGAADYNPAYYGLVGSAGRAFRGEAMLFAMRAAGGLLCAVVVGLALWAAAGVGRWVTAGVATGLTPVVLYATVNVAPNGLEMCAGVLMWTAGAALVAAGESRRALWWVLALAVSLVATLHTLGPLWCAGFVACLLALGGGRRVLRDAWHRHRPSLLGAGVAVALVAVADAAWMLTRAPNLGEGDDYGLGRVTAGRLAEQLPVWAIQTTGTVPFRDQYLPTVVFAALLVLLMLLVGLAVVRGSWEERGAVVGLAFTFFAVPVVLTIATYDRLGMAWQGRYALPLVAGVPVLAGWVLTRRGWPPIMRPLPGLICLALPVVNAVGLVAVARAQERRWAVLDWSAPPTLLLLGLGVAAVALATLGVLREGAPGGPETGGLAHDVAHQGEGSGAVAAAQGAWQGRDRVQS